MSNGKEKAPNQLVAQTCLESRNRLVYHVQMDSPRSPSLTGLNCIASIRYVFGMAESHLLVTSLSSAGTGNSSKYNVPSKYLSKTFKYKLKLRMTESSLKRSTNPFFETQHYSHGASCNSGWSTSCD